LRGEKKPGKSKAVVKFDSHKQWLRFAHQGVLAIFNFSERAQRVPLPAGDWELAMRSDEAGQRASDNVPARTTLIYRSRATA
jgi:hypothetical protein